MEVEDTVRSITVTVTFASTHREPTEGPHKHGHTFYVTAEELGSDAGVRADTRADLTKVVSELHLHSLDEMLVGGQQTLDGIGAWIMERMLMRHPRLVTVDDLDG